MRKVLTILALSTMLVGGACTTTKHASPMQEDEAGWDCKTMGNRICGEWNPEQGRIEYIYYPPS